MAEEIRSDAAEDAPIERAEETPSAPVTFFTQLRQALFPAPYERAVAVTERLQQLNDNIAEVPSCISAYVLRGEFHLDLGDYAAAEDDFRTALNLAENELQTALWGLTTQELRDRAAAGLEDATRHIKIKNEFSL
jgi:tetratricopeptide (TPR) repeat protein